MSAKYQEQEVIYVRVSPELKTKVKKAANKDGKTINEYVTDLLRQNLEATNSE